MKTQTPDSSSSLIGLASIDPRSYTEDTYKLVSTILGSEVGLDAMKATDNKGRSALSYALEKGNLSLVEMMIEAASKEPGLVNDLIFTDESGKEVWEWSNDPKTKAYLETLKNTNKATPNRDQTTLSSTQSQPNTPTPAPAAGGSKTDKEKIADINKLKSYLKGFVDIDNWNNYKKMSRNLLFLRISSIINQTL